MINIQYKYHGSRNLWRLSFTDEEKLEEWLNIFGSFVDYRRDNEEPFLIELPNGITFPQETVEGQIQTLIKKVNELQQQIHRINR